MVAERILTFDLKCFPIKVVILIEVMACFFDKCPMLIITDFQTFIFDQSNEFCIKNPVYKIIFVFEVIVEAFSVHVAPLADLGNVDFLKGKLSHQLLQGGGQCVLGNVGISHIPSPFALQTPRGRWQGLRLSVCGCYDR